MCQPECYPASKRRSSRLRSHGALRQSLTTLTSVLCGGQLINVREKEDTTVHATSRISSSEPAPELSQSITCASHCGIGSDIGEAAETASEISRLKCCFYIDSDFAINCSQLVRYLYENKWIKSENI